MPLIEDSRPLRRVIIVTLALLLSPLTARAATVVLGGVDIVDDSTLYEDDTDGNAGSDLGLFAGVTGLNSPRRAVIRFDTSSIASDAIVREVSLRLVVERTRGAADTHSLHRVTAPWVEGDGVGTGLGGGGGGTVVTGAVTWDSREHPAVPWSSPGGDFVAAASASAQAPSVGAVTWTDSTPGDGLVADVQSWISDPTSNHGWLLRGEESGPLTARRYTSSEAGGPNAPALTVELVIQTDVPTDGVLLR